MRSSCDATEAGLLPGYGEQTRSRIPSGASIWKSRTLNVYKRSQPDSCAARNNQDYNHDSDPALALDCSQASYQSSAILENCIEILLPMSSENSLIRPVPSGSLPLTACFSALHNRVFDSASKLLT